MKKYEIKNMNGTVLSACAHISEVLEQLRNQILLKKDQIDKTNEKFLERIL